MKQIPIIITLLCLLCMIAYAENKSFILTFGDIFDDVAYSSKQTEDGGYIIAGIIDRHAEDIFDVVIRKLKEDGTEDWFEILTSNYDDRVYSLCLLKNNEYALAGHTSHPSKGDKDMAIMRISKLGMKVWAKIHGGKENDAANSIQLTEDNNFLTAGYTESFGKGKKDMWVAKINRKKGFKMWGKYFGGKEDDVAYSIQPTKDNGFIVVGYTKSFKAKKADIWVLKFNRAKTKEWAKIFGGKKNEKAYSVKQIEDGYIIGGYTESLGAGKKDFLIIKIDNNGKRIWSKTFGGKKDEEARAMQQTKDEGFIIVGYTESFGKGKKDIWLVKTDKDGNKLWTKTYGGAKNEEAYSIQQTKDGGYIIAGYTESFGNGFKDFYIIKTDKNGNVPK